MRDALMFLIVFGGLALTFKRPAIGVLLYTWVSLMSPHRLAYGAANDFPFAAVIAAFTAVCALIHPQRMRLPITPVTITLLMFTAWLTLTSFTALEPLLVWREWDRVIKTMFMVFLTMMVINTKTDIKLLAWVIGLSLGLYGLKGGLFTIATGGNFRVFGPDGSYIEENNSMALALVTVLPIIWYLRSQVSNRWLSRAMMAMALCTAVSAMGSYSRGALIGMSAMLLFLWIKSPKKGPAALAVVAIGAMMIFVMPEQWFERMNTISAYKEDGSAMGRINAWHFAINVAMDNLMGGGFNVFSFRQFLIYAPDPLDYHVAHSIYFQVLGDQGFIGLAMYLALMVFAWRTGTRVIRFCADQADLKWASDLAKMAQVSLIGFAVSGAFLSLAYYDLYYDIIIILVLLEKVLVLRGGKSQDSSGRSSSSAAAPLNPLPPP